MSAFTWKLSVFCLFAQWNSVFSRFNSDRVRGNGFQLCNGKLRLDVRQNFSTRAVGQPRGLQGGGAFTSPAALPQRRRCDTERRGQWGGLGLSLEVFSNLNDSMNMVGFWVGQQLVCCLLPGLTVQIASGFLLGLQKSPTICLVTLETAQESQFPCITSLVAESCDPGANSHLCDAQAEWCKPFISKTVGIWVLRCVELFPIAPTVSWCQKCISRERL